MNIKISLSTLPIVGFTFQIFQNNLKIHSALGGDSESSGEISAIQDKLLSDLTDALGDVLKLKL